MADNFVELHCHTDKGSNIRMLDSTVKTEKLIDKAIEYGFKGVAITDHEALCSHIDAILKWKEIHEEHPDFKLILGNEIYLINEADYQNTDNFFHFILLAKDKEGHKQLRQLSTRAWKRSYTYKRMERVPTFYSDLQEIVGSSPGHLVASTACLGGLLPYDLLNDKESKALNFTSWCRNLFGEDNFYIELQPGISEEQIEFNKKTADFCKKNNFNWIITNDVHYLTREKRTLHAAFLNSKDEDRETDSFYESTYLKKPEEMRERMGYLDSEFISKGFENTVKIADMVESYDLQQDVIVPERPLPEFGICNLFANWYDKYEYINKFAHSEYKQDLFMLYLIEEGFKERKQEFNETNLARIDVELEQLWKISIKLNQRMSAYYNLVRMLVDLMWSEGDSLIGVSRGSVTGYYVTYLMGIIQINPIEWDLPYWRHLSSERPELPDVDLDSQASHRPLIFQKIKEMWGENRTLNIITYRTETSKSAVLTSARGLGIDVDTAHELSNLIPVNRGKVMSIHDCLYGNETEGTPPVTEFVNKAKQFPNFIETVEEIEGLVSGRSSHASGLYLFNQDYIEQNSMMKTPKGTVITCWDQAASDYCGALKVDELVTECLDKMRKCMDSLLDDEKIEWQGSLRATYEKYFSPDTINYTESKMWDLADNGQIYNLFEFDTEVGGQAIKKIKPRNLRELALSSSVMRLMGDGTIDPIERFVSYKNDISLWYKEMKDYGLNEDEIRILEKYLKRNSGNSIEQEDVMELSMDEHIAGFDIVAANKLRKSIAKKKKKLMEEIRDKFYSHGQELGTRKIMLDYVWDYAVKPQLGYSFSRNHTLPYSCMGLIEMNMAYFYPSIYWNCACLTINAQANEDVDDNKSTNYGKIAKAIGDMQHRGVKIALPEVNSAGFEFKPDEKNNQIIFGLKGMNGIGDDIAKQIIDNRPYSSFENFFEKNQFDTKVCINLIKGGCFDEFMESRQQAMTEYLKILAKQKVEPKTSLTMANFGKCVELDIIPKEFDFQKRLYIFHKEIFSKDHKYEDGVHKNLFILNSDAEKIFFDSELVKYISEDSEYITTENGICLVKSKFDKWYNSNIEQMKNWATAPETAVLFTKASYNAFATDVWNKYCLGTKSKWEMDSLSFYYSGHELANINKAKYELTDYEIIPETPVVIGQMERKNKSTGEVTSWDKYQLYKIAGTVLDKNSNKYYITLLTTTGVVTVKFYAGAYVNYDKQISTTYPSDTKKTVVEKSWFQRGNKLIITGIRRGDMFYPKRYYDTVFQHTVTLIKNVYENGDLDLQFERERV